MVVSANRLEEAVSKAVETASRAVDAARSDNDEIAASNRKIAAKLKGNTQTALPLWHVTIPVAAHAEIQVEAETETKAIERAKALIQLCDLASFEALDYVMLGNVCHFPRPWEASADLLEEEAALS